MDEAGSGHVRQRDADERPFQQARVRHDQLRRVVDDVVAEQQEVDVDQRAARGGGRRGRTRPSAASTRQADRQQRVRGQLGLDARGGVQVRAAAASGATASVS